MSEKQAKSVNKPSTSRLQSWATVTALAISVSAVLLSLLGYGVAAAIESTFGISHTYAYDSTLDLLTLSNYAIMAAIDFSAKVLESQEFKAITLKATVFGLVLTAFFLVLRTEAILALTREPRIYIKLHWIKFKNTKIKNFKIWLISNRFALLPLGIGAIPLIAWAAITPLFLAPALIPWVGYELAKHHFQKWVIEADYCNPIHSKQDRLAQSKQISANIDGKSANLALCLALWKDGVPIAEGRHIVSTSSHIMLFDPISGNVWSEPLNGISIRAISALSAES